MSYWHNDASNGGRTQAASGKRMASASSTAKPTFFHNEADVTQFYPPMPAQQAVRRTKPGGQNVLRTAEANDKRSQQIEINRESSQTQQLASWHSQHERSNKLGARRRNEKQLDSDLDVANAELKVLRRARLKQFLEAEHQQFKRELAAKGLAILHDEP